MSAVACPARDDLSAYLLGDLPTENRESVAAHVETCSACQSTLASLSSVQDELVLALRQQRSSQDYAHESDFQQALARLVSPSPLLGEGRGEVHAPLSPGGRGAGGEGADLGSIGPDRLRCKLGEGGMGGV
jgi:hypothetical protein